MKNVLLAVALFLNLSAFTSIKNESKQCGGEVYMAPAKEENPSTRMATFNKCVAAGKKTEDCLNSLKIEICLGRFTGHQILFDKQFNLDLETEKCMAEPDLVEKYMSGQQ